MMVRQTHVAILDDDPSVRVALVRLLKAAGMVARAYATGDELFKSIALNCPDCLLLDIEMPEMNGLDVLKYLNRRHIRIPTIVITGSGATDLCSDCLNAGAMIFLDKPLDADQLIRSIEKISGSSQPDRLSSAG
jgi:FixJ family two-component response regulator